MYIILYFQCLFTYNTPTSLSGHINMYLHIHSLEHLTSAHVYLALYSRVQFGQRESSQHFCFSDNDTKQYNLHWSMIFQHLKVEIRLTCFTALNIILKTCNTFLNKYHLSPLHELVVKRWHHTHITAENCTEIGSACSVHKVRTRTGIFLSMLPISVL